MNSMQGNDQMQKQNQDIESRERNVVVIDEDIIVTEYLISVMDKIFDPLPVPFILIDKDTRIRMINEVFANFLGFSKEEVMGKAKLNMG